MPLFSIEEMTYTPTKPRLKEAFTVKGKVKLFNIPFVLPVWCIVTVEYPETLIERILPLIGAKEVRKMATVLGGDFEIKFPTGFLGEGKFLLTTRVYAGPTIPIDSITLPPFPPVASDETTFMVVGELSPEEQKGFRNLKVTGYSKNGARVTVPSVINVNVGDRLTVYVSYEHKGDASSEKLYGAIGAYRSWNITDPFGEVIANEVSISVPKSADWAVKEESVVIPITTAISPGSGYDLYVKIPGVEISPYYENVITVGGGGGGGPTYPSPEVQALKIVSYDTPVQQGQYCNIYCQFQYRGTANTIKMRATIGNDGFFGFDELLGQDVDVPVSASMEWVTYSIIIPITITSAISAGTYDVYFKVKSTWLPAKQSDILQNVITVGGGGGGVTPTTVTFDVWNTNLPTVYGATGIPELVQYWALYYWPEGENYKCPSVGCGAWILTGQASFLFKEVKSPGHLSCYLHTLQGTTSQQYDSQLFTPENGATYNYNVATGTVTKR